MPIDNKMMIYKDTEANNREICDQYATGNSKNWNELKSCEMKAGIAQQIIKRQKSSYSGRLLTFFV